MHFNTNNQKVRVLKRALEYYKALGGRDAKLDSMDVEELLSSVNLLIISKRKRPLSMFDNIGA